MKKLSLLLILNIALLSSCNDGISVSTDVNNSFSDSSSLSSADSGNDGYTRLSSSVETYHSFGKHSLEKKIFSNAIGDIKTLVVPVIIDGYEEYATEEIRNNIELAFFGKNSPKLWESVSSYFYKSSYGKLNLSGEVTPWVDIDMTPKDIYNANNQYYDYGTFTVLEKVYDWLKNNNYDLSQYDLDEDGYIDSIYMIYSAPSRIEFDGVEANNPDNPFWALTYHDFNIVNNAHSHANPIPNAYSWASFDLMNKGTTVGITVDAHTYIHEMGHIFGLVDYYDYDGLHSPLGCFDMQDFNVGDHNAYSKYALGWVEPYLVESDATITINPMESSGDCIIVRNPNSKFSNSAFDEYLMLELITPTGLWKQDSEKAYPGLNTKTFTNAGVRITHVDGRLRNNRGNIVTTISNGDSVTHLASNTPSRSFVKTGMPKYDLISIVNANRATGTQTNALATATNQSLFKAGQIFTSGDYSSFFRGGQFNNGESIPFKITFQEVNDTKAVINFRYIG